MAKSGNLLIKSHASTNTKNKLICGDSLHVMESLLHYENLRGKVQMIYVEPHG
jgi:hypothetical protein